MTTSIEDPLKVFSVCSIFLGYSVYRNFFQVTYAKKGYLGFSQDIFLWYVIIIPSKVLRFACLEDPFKVS